jgi:hypothetical protein
MPRPLALVLAAALVTLAGTSCHAGAVSSADIRPDATASPGGSATLNGSVGAPVFDPANFTRSTVVDNAYFPLRPGTLFRWEGHALDDGERIERGVVFIVTDLTKVVDGVRTIVAWDRDYDDGRRNEMELAFFAQDDDGNVWLFGEYPEEYEGRKIVKTPAWIAGLERARPGITMYATNREGTPSYAQGWGPAIHWSDRARVDQVGIDDCAPVDCFADVLVVDEFNRDRPRAHQLKYYAPGVGGIRVGWRGANEEEREVLVLVELAQLTPEQLAEVDRRVLEQEDRAYELLAAYGGTEPIESADAA